MMSAKPILHRPVGFLLLLPVLLLTWMGCGGSYQVASESTASGQWTIGLTEFARRTVNRRADVLLRDGDRLEGTILAARQDTIYVYEGASFRALAVPIIQSVSIRSGIPVGYLSIPGGFLGGTIIGGLLAVAVEPHNGWARFGGAVAGALVGTVAGTAAAIFGSNATVYEFTDQAIVQVPLARER